MKSMGRNRVKDADEVRVRRVDGPGLPRGAGGERKKRIFSFFGKEWVKLEDTSRVAL